MLGFAFSPAYPPRLIVILILLAGMRHGQIDCNSLGRKNPMIHRWLLLFATFAITGVIFDRAYAEDDVLIKRVKTTWRAQDGATIDDILSHVAKIAHFVPRGWEVGQKHGFERQCNSAGNPLRCLSLPEMADEYPFHGEIDRVVG